MFARTTNPQNGADDVITGDLGDRPHLRRQGADTILGNDGDDLILGDQGYIHYPTPDSGVELPDVVTTCMDPNIERLRPEHRRQRPDRRQRRQRHRLRRHGAAT